ncbi:hypothetical protein [Escherichia phage vB-EcoP-XT73]|nr:hypothetical protein [Escherichia phage vB-EcoP-XT73]
MIYSEILNKVREMRKGDAVVDVLVHLVASLQEENDLLKKEIESRSRERDRESLRNSTPLF